MPVSLGLVGGGPVGADFTLPAIALYQALLVTAEPSSGTSAPTSAPVVAGSVKPV